MTPRCVVTDHNFPDLRSERAAADRNGAAFASHQSVTAADVAAVVRDANVAVVQFAPFDATAIEALAPGATIIRYGVGYDNIDIDAARKAGVKVGYVPDYCVDEVAEHTVAAILTLLRKLPVLDRSVRSGAWDPVAVARPIKPFADTVIGFFGFGQIGRAVWYRLRGFGFSGLVSDPALDPQSAGRLGLELTDVDTVFAKSDAITLHAPANAATTGFVNAERLDLMQRHAVIVNTARGQLIDEIDLADALYNGTIGGAALDVFETEPLPVGSPLRQAANCLITPHAAWYSDAAIGRLQSLVAQDIERALTGKPPRRPVPGF